MMAPKQSRDRKEAGSSRMLSHRFLTGAALMLHARRVRHGEGAPRAHS